MVGETPEPRRPAAGSRRARAASSSPRARAACSAACSSAATSASAGLKGFAGAGAGLAGARRGRSGEPLRGPARRPSLTPLVGREQELALLLDRWQQAKDGRGPGGAARRASPASASRASSRALRERLRDEPHTRLRYYCSPYHHDSALYPVIDQLERAAGFDARTTRPRRKLAKLEALLAPGRATTSTRPCR